LSLFPIPTFWKLSSYKWDVEKKGFRFTIYMCVGGKANNRNEFGTVTIKKMEEPLWCLHSPKKIKYNGQTAQKLLRLTNLGK